MLKEEIEKTVKSDDQHDYSAILASAKFHNPMVAFAKERDTNFQYWWQYMDMVCILLLHFIRVQQDGIWELHLCTFQQMLLYFHRYDPMNYARCGCIYLAEMDKLPDEVKEEFCKGNFVVKGSDQRYNQVDPDHSQEWLNGTGKKGGGIVGITKTTSALSRCPLSFILRAYIVNKISELFHVGSDDQMIYNETTPGRMKRDNEDQDKVIAVLHRFKVFSPDMTCDVLQNI